MKIGVFDSGFGGLSVLAKLMERLPEYDYAYVGDAARAPYGVQPRAKILAYTKQAIDFFAEQQCSLVILACNTASALALREIQQHYLPACHPDMRVLGVLIPAAEAAVAQTQQGMIGVLATPATVHSESFVEEIEKLAPRAVITQVACPAFVPLIEAGAPAAVIDAHAQEYCQLLGRRAVDTVILGCTHYELIRPLIQRHLDATVVAEGGVVAQKLAQYLTRHDNIERRLHRTGTRCYYTTGAPAHFNEQAQRLVAITCRARQVVLDEATPPMLY